MTKVFSMIGAAVMLTLAIGAFQPSHAATASFAETQRSYSQSPH